MALKALGTTAPINGGFAVSWLSTDIAVTDDSIKYALYLLVSYMCYM